LVSLSFQDVRAAEFTVQMRDFSFTPKTVTIDVGDTVTWINAQGSHDVQSDKALFKSPAAPVQRFSFTFTAPGTIGYHCNPHVAFGMVGTVIVRTPVVTNAPPSVAITAPANNAIFTVPANISITADATDNGGVAKVEFFDGSASLGSVTTPPFSINATLAEGSHTLTAKATDNEGASTDSAPVAVTVNAPAGPINLLSPVFPVGGPFGFQVTGLGGKPSIIEVSSTLFGGSWQPILTNNAPPEPFTFTDPASAGVTIRFYRVRQP
jgi:plastocyanin